MAPTNEGTPDLPRNELEALHRFTGVMIEKLVKNRHKGGWSGDHFFTLDERLDQEVSELYSELLKLDRLLRLDAGAQESAAWKEQLLEQKKRVARECADVANFAMMIADVVGGLEP